MAGDADGGFCGRLGVGAVLLALLVLLTTGPSVASAASPTVGEVWVSTVAPTTARLNAEVDPGGKASTYHFDYITQSAYQANLGAGKDGFAGTARFPSGAEATVLGTVPTTVSPLLFGLSPGTAYRYRIVVTNPDGSDTGPVQDFATHSTAPFALPDGRGWEMVSPVEKNGGRVEAPGALAGGGVLQAAPDGQSVTYGSAASFAGGAQGAPPASQYVARRDAGGWSTENVSLSLLSGSYPDPQGGTPYRLFSGDLARAVHLNGNRCAAGDPCPHDYYLRETLTGSLLTSPSEPDLRFAGGSPDLSHLVLSTCAALTPNAVEVPLGDGCDPAAPNLYMWSAGGLSLVNVLPSMAQGNPGAALGAQSAAVSADGGRVYWSDLASGNLHLRTGGQTRQVDAAAGGGGAFETASADGAVAFYTKAGHLWRYDAIADTSTDLTPSGGVLGVLGASSGASRVYYLTGAGLFLRDGATTVKVADAADAGNYPPTTGTARVSADGTKLLFVSTTPLTTSDGATYDNTDLGSGNPDSQVYLYDALAKSLTCVSCNPTHARPLGPSTIPGALANGQGAAATHSYKPRALSADGRRVFFETRDALVLSDANLARDVYQWEAQGKGSCTRPGGCVALISAGLAGTSSFVDASSEGDDAFFLTDRSLVGVDPGSVDLYDARVGGGFPEPVPPSPCLGDACQVVPPAPEDPVLTTVLPGPGNPAERYVTYRRRQPKKCRGAKRKQGAKCVKKGAGKKGKKGSGKRRAGARGGQR